MAVKFTRDSAGIAQILKSGEVSAMCATVAGQIAANVRAAKPGADVVVDTYATDRSAASVTIRDVRALAWQANEGVLTRAAAGVGAEVTEKPIEYTTKAGKKRAATSAQIRHWTRGRR